MQQPTSSSAALLDLHGVFSSVDVAGEGVAAPAVDEGLLEIVPAPLPLDFPQLEEEVRSQRRIFVHDGAAVPVAALVSVGGALFFHACIVGVFVVCYLYMPRTPAAGGGKSGAVDSGGFTSSYMVAEDPADSHVIPTAMVAPAQVTTAAPVSPTPPAPLVPVPPAPQIASAVQLPSPVDPIIGLAAGRDPAAPVPPAVTSPVPPFAPPVAGLPIAPPPTNPVLASPITSPLPGQPVVAHGRPGPVRPGPDEADNNDEETIDLSANGSGSGAGKHHGSGIDRGASGANNETPAVLDAPAFKLWADYLFHPPAKRVILSVNVLADGSAGAIEIVQSCGSREVDLAYKSHVALHYRFRPAYREGRPFAAAIQCSQSFGTDDE